MQYFGNNVILKNMTSDIARYQNIVPSFSKVQFYNNLSRLVRKPTICIGENKDADQLRGDREAVLRLCFRYTDSTLTLLLKSKISSFKPASAAVQAGLCQTCSETTLLVFSTRRLIGCSNKDSHFEGDI